MVAAAQGLCAGAAHAQPAQPVPQTPEQVIIVTGTRIQQPGLVSTSPVETVRPRDITLTGVANVEQTLNRFPQIAPSFSNTSNNPGSGGATLDLRGLGSVRTLVLVNGRRWIASDAGEVPEVDVNTIPAALIERVDIVTGGASAVYGSDAVTGVINFILKDDLDGLHLDARQSISSRGDSRTSSADLSFGASFLGGRGSLIVSAGWLDQEPSTQAQRDYTRFALSEACVVPGTRDRFGASTAAANPDGVCDGPGEMLGYVAGASPLIPGSRLQAGGSPILLPGTGGLLRTLGNVRFTPDGSILPFTPADRFNFAPENFLQVGLERYSGNLLASIEITSAFEPYAELSFVHTLSPQQIASTPGFLPAPVLNIDNPFFSAETQRALDISFGIDRAGNPGFLRSGPIFRPNPAYLGDADGLVTVPGILFVRLTGLSPRQRRNKRDAYRGLLGLRGALGPTWDYDLFYSRSRVDHDTELANSASAARLRQAILARRDPATGQIVCIDPSGGCAPANIFGVGNLGPEGAAFIETDPSEKTVVEEEVAEASLTGEAVQLPAGPLGLAVGASWRRTSYRFDPDPSLATGDDLGFMPGVAAAGETEVRELFAEARVPILRDKRLAHELSAELGLRYSDYDTVGGVWTWKALASWAPVREVRLRGGFQRAVRAPNVRELFEAPTSATGGDIDPCDAGLIADTAFAAACVRNGAPPGFVSTAAPTVRSRGTPTLKAETARTLTAGLVATPLPGVTLTADYYEIKIDDAIGTFGGGPAFTVFGCIAGGADPADPLCRAYVRAANGNILSYDLPTANLPRLSARGVDWQLSVNRPLLGGRVDIGLSGTRLFSLTSKFNENAPALECAGFFGALCGITISGTASPKWKLYNRLSYSFGPRTLTLRHRYIDGTTDGRFAVRSAFGLPAPTGLVPAEGRRLESVHYFDLAASFAIGRRFDLTVGVDNLTDPRPPVLSSGFFLSNNTDLIGRRFFATLSARLF
jgi:outer membrane receptor protein involved in Fe transport